jgi:hypothetical protein
MPSDEPTQAPQFRLYLVLTKRVIDAGGRRDQERYLGLFEQAPAAGWRSLNSNVDASISVNDPLVARVVEVQSRREWGGAATESAFWDALFPKAADDRAAPDAVARIVRVSRPILASHGVNSSRTHVPPRCSADECHPVRP